MINFGDIFRHKEELYVYLVQADEILYAAKIISREETARLIRFRDQKSKNPLNKTHEKPAYCLVVLTTEEFRDQGAHYGFPQMDEGIEIQSVNRLSEEDIQSLHDEIEADAATYPALKKAVSELFNPI